MITSRLPLARWIRILFRLNMSSMLVSREKSSPLIINGTPRPSEYISNSEAPLTGEFIANMKILPSIGPIHGVQPTAKAIPRGKALNKPNLRLLGINRISLLRVGILRTPIIKRPITIMIVPATRSVRPLYDCKKAPAKPKADPIREKIMEKPRTKRIVEKKMRVR